MKKFQLSTPAERSKGIIFALITVIAMVALLFALRNDIIILGLYVMNVAKAACYPDAEKKTLRVTGFQERSIDLSKATCLETITVKSGHVEGRSLAFSDAEGNVVAIVPTYFTSNRGVLAEPMAMELAKELNLEFFANVPAWEYDEEAREAHEKEVAQQQKEDAKQRREAKKAYREAQIRKKMADIRNEKK